MRASGPSAPRLTLAGLDARDVASAAHPYLHLAGLEAQADKAAARRARTARFTPGGLPQPPEVMGVDADPRVPNPLQPMSGEFEAGHEVDAGRPAFFGPAMPPPTGIADDVGVERGLNVNRPFGAPTGMVVRAPALGADRFDWRPPVPANGRDLAALPHFAAGGIVPPGQTGVVGEQGTELVKALPGGGAQVAPLPPAAAPAGLAKGFAAPPGRTAADGPLAPPPPQESAQQGYAALARGLAAARPPDPDDPALRTPTWKRALGVAFGALAAGLARRPDPGLGAAMYETTAPDLYTEAEQRYAANQRSQLAGLAPLLSAAKLEQSGNADATRAWQTQAEDTWRRQQAAAGADYRTRQLQDREQAERERERQDQALDAERRRADTARASDQQARDNYRNQALDLRRQLQAAKAPDGNAQTTQAALRSLLGAGSRAQAEQYLAGHRAVLAARGANLGLLQRALDQRWPPTAAGPRQP